MSEEKPAPYLKVDWNKWCDEDEESANCKFNLNICSSNQINYSHLLWQKENWTS